MEQKTARLTLLIDPNKKAAFERLCARLDLTPSQVVRQLIREFLRQHGTEYLPVEATTAPTAQERPRAKRDAKPPANVPTKRTRARRTP